jgi:DNA-binding protein HU-beta
MIAAIAEDTEVSKADVGKVLSSLAAHTADSLRRSEPVVLGGIGKLSSIAKEAREARNPATGAMIKVPAKRVVKFKVTKELADAVA